MGHQTQTQGANTGLEKTVRVLLLQVYTVKPASGKEAECAAAVCVENEGEEETARIKALNSQHAWGQSRKGAQEAEGKE